MQSKPRRRALKSGRTLVFLALLGLGISAWSQQRESPAAISAGKAQAQMPYAATAPGAQSPGGIHGVVTGENGEVYQGVRVVLARIGHGASPASVQTTDSAGSFNFTNVPPGAFQLTFSSIGFTTKALSGVLQPGQTYDAQTIVLPVATAITEVQVSASQQSIAVQQFHAEVQQRVLGVVPNFYVTYVPNAPPLTTRQKYALAWKSSIDPVTWAVTGAFAGVEQAENTFSGYGQGAQGYGKRFAANYADAFISTMLGGAVLPSLFKQDPRYFYKGTGTIRSRALYAIANAVICKGDNGHWQVNYSAILGGLAAGGISNLYYPASDREGVELTFGNALIGIGEGAVGNIFQEFVVRKLTPKAHHAETDNP